MKLSFTTTELEEGVSVRQIGDKRKAKIADEMTTCGAFSITPTKVKGAWCSGVILKKIEGHGNQGFHKITFTPVAVNVFEVHEKGGDLNALVLDTPQQVMIDRNDIRKCRMTLSGEGADPTLVERAQGAFGKLVSSESGNPIVRRMIRHFAETL